MKTAHLLILLTVFAVPAFSQERPRYFDNFDTSRGVNVVKPKPVASTAKANVPLKPDVTPSGTVKVINGKRYLVPTGSAAAVKPTKTRSKNGKMNAAEGFAAREMSAFSAAPRLTMGTNAAMKGFTTGDPVHDSYIVDSSRKYGIDPLLIYAQMHQESAFKVRATSHKGASGLMQLMPATARRLGVTNIYDPKQNIEGGVKYMRMLLDMFGGNVTLALAGYNAGEGAVMRYGNNVPPFNETREYVRRISARYTAISDGSFARNSRPVSAQTAAKLEKKESRPLTVYEPGPVAIRLADGRMRLVNQ